MHLLAFNILLYIAGYFMVPKVMRKARRILYFPPFPHKKKQNTADSQRPEEKKLKYTYIYSELVPGSRS